MVKVKKKSGFARVQKVWHITDFRELFELPDDLRKKRTGPLSYTKSFVSLTGKSQGHEIKHCERLSELKSHSERHLLRSVFEDLKNFSGKKSLAHRGYLVTTSSQPAGYEYLASQLKVKVEDLKQAVPVLEQIGLIERISMNGFTDEAGPKKAKRGAGKKGKSEKSGMVRNSPDASGKRRETLKKRKRNQSKGKVNSNKHKTTQQNGNGKDNTKRAKERQVKEEPQRNPTQPFLPQISARGGSATQFSAPSELKNTEQLGDIAKGMLHKYNPDAKRFALEIYEALELPWDPMSETGRRELGCFASVWQKTWANKANFEVIEELRARAIGEAKKIGKRRVNKKRGAVWCHVFKNLLASRCGKKAM